LLALACFANTLGHGFVYDDHFQILESEAVLGDWRPENLARAFDRDVWGFFLQRATWQGKIRTDHYRPLFPVFFMAASGFAHSEPWRWHLVVVVLHALAAVLAYFVVVASLGRIQAAGSPGASSRSIAVLAASFFALHPAQSESVAWISASVGSLSAVFLLASVLAYLAARSGAGPGRWGWLGLASLLGGLALLSKESAICLPLLIAAYELNLSGSAAPWRARLRDGLVVTLPFVALAALYLGMRIALLGSVRPSFLGSPLPSLGVTLLSLPAILARYAQSVLWPFALSPSYPVRPVLAPGLWNFALPATLLALSGALGALLATRSALIRLGLIWLVVPLLPVLDTRSFAAEALVRDRYLYLSLLGAGILFAASCRWLGSRLAPREDALFAAMLLTLLGSVTLGQNRIWADEWSLWSAAQRADPLACTPNEELGRLSDKARQDEAAEAFYLLALSACPDNARVHYRLGHFYGARGDLVRSEAAFRRMAELVEFRLVKANAYFNLGVVYERRGDLEGAVSHYRVGLRLSSDSRYAAEVRGRIADLEARLSAQRGR
jgi:tetratricopeptide (TPR) repeat protein